MLRFLQITLLLALLVSCRKEFDKPKYKTEIIAPLVQTSLGISDIVKDSSFRKNSDSTISIVYSQKLDSFGLSVLDTFSAQPFKRSAKLSTLKLDPISDTLKMTLGQVAKSDPTYGDIIIANHGKTILLFPGLTGVSIGPYLLDLKQYFESITLNSGFADFLIENQFPVDMKNVVVKVNNSTDNAPIIDTIIPLVKSRSSVKGTISLANKTVEGHLISNVTTDLASGYNIKIDTNDYVKAVFTVRDLNVKEATAIFPSQPVVEDRVDIPLENMGSRELVEAALEEGYVTIVANSTMEDSIFFTYTLPGAFAPGSNNPFVIHGTMPPAPPGGSINKEFSKSFNGFKLDLTGKDKNTFNTIYSDLEGRIKYSGKKVHLSLQDSFYVNIYTRGIRPKYAKGYLGDTLISFNGSIPVNILDKIPSQKLSFEKANVAIDIKNEIGVGAVIKINNLTASNPSSNPNSASLEDATIIGKDISIVSAQDGNPIKPGLSVINTDKAAPLVNIFPKNISYQADLKIGDQVKTHTNFAYNGKYVRANLNIEIPLSFIASGFQLSDTVNISPVFTEQLKNGFLIVHAKNGFPLEAKVNLYFADANGSIIDSLISNRSLDAAVIDGSTRKVKVDGNGKYIKAASKVTYPLEEATLGSIRNSKKIIFKAYLDTKPDQTNVKIYEDYTIDFKLAGDLKIDMN